MSLPITISLIYSIFKTAISTVFNPYGFPSLHAQQPQSFGIFKLPHMSTTTTTTTTTTLSSSQTIPQNDDGLPEQQSCLLKFLQLVVILILIISAMIYFNPSRINAQYVEFQPLPSVNISYGLDYAEAIFRSRRSLKGPESIAVHPSNGFLYSGTQDGKIVRANLQKPYSSSPETLGVMGNPNAALPLPCGTYTTEPICGRPLGMEFNRLRDDEKRDDVLFLVDAYLGVAMHNPRTHSLSILVGASFQTTDGTKINEPVTFNDVAYDGVANKLYFTLSSTRFRLNDLFFDLLEMGQSGMVCAYDMSTKQIDIVAKDIAFANGVVFDPKKQVLYVSELTRARIIRPLALLREVPKPVEQITAVIQADEQLLVPQDDSEKPADQAPADEDVLLALNEETALKDTTGTFSTPDSIDQNVISISAPNLLDQFAVTHLLSQSPEEEEEEEEGEEEEEEEVCPAPPLPAQGATLSGNTKKNMCGSQWRLRQLFIPSELCPELHI